MKRISHFCAEFDEILIYRVAELVEVGSGRPPHPKTINLILCEKKYRARKTPDDLIRT